MVDPSLLQLLGRSLALVQDELPEAHAAICRALGRRSILLRVEEEVGTLRGAPPRLSLRVGYAPSDVELSTGLHTIRRLTAGEGSLLDAVMDGHVDLQGAIDDVIALHEVFVAYVAAVVRCPGCAALREELLAPPVTDGGTPAPHIGGRNEVSQATS